MAISFHDAQQELISAVDRINCGVAARDIDGKLVFANERLLGWLGYGKEELIGQHFLTVIPEELHSVIAEEVEAIDHGDARLRVVAMRRKDSTTFPVLLIPPLHIDAADPGRLYFAVIVDLGSVQTAKSLTAPANSLRGRLDQVVNQLQSLALSAEASPSWHVSLDHPDLASLSQRER